MAERPRIEFDFDMTEGFCFGCGQNNPIGLKLDFKKEDSIVRAEFTPARVYQGWKGVLHGGITAAVLDEAMGWATKLNGLNCVTARLRVSFKRPVAIGERLIITAAIVKQTDKYVETEAKMTLPDGTLMAQGSGTHAIIESKEAGS